MTMDPTAAADQLPFDRTSTRHGTRALLDANLHHKLQSLQSERVPDIWGLSNLMSRSGMPVKRHCRMPEPF